MNLASLIILLLVAMIVFLCIRSLVREKRSGSCGCGCSSCSGSCPHCAVSPDTKGDMK